MVSSKVDSLLLPPTLYTLLCMYGCVHPSLDVFMVGAEFLSNAITTLAEKGSVHLGKSAEHVIARTSQNENPVRVDGSLAQTLKSARSASQNLSKTTGWIGNALVIAMREELITPISDLIMFSSTRKDSGSSNSISWGICSSTPHFINKIIFTR